MFFHPECPQGVQSGAAVTGGLMATASFVYWYGRRHVWSRPSEFTVPVLLWLWWEAYKACYQNASPSPGKHELLMQISAMQKSKGRACVWLKPHFGALSGSWINGAIGPSSAPALPSRPIFSSWECDSEVFSWGSWLSLIYWRSCLSCEY